MSTKLKQNPSPRIYSEKLKKGNIILKMKGISKSFPNVIALDKVDFEIRTGEIHSILGENGAGKTTLMNILYGLYKSDEGEIFIEGKKVEIREPRDAIKLGIGMIHQHFQLVPTLSALRNITLGHEPTRLGWFLDTKKAKQKVQDIMKEYGLEVNLETKVSDLEVGERQRVEITKALYRKSKILIMDEPTSILTPQESKKLMETLKKLSEKNLAVIPFISHKLDEVLSISDRITVLRNGHLVQIMDAAKTDKKKLARAMVGRELIFRTKGPKARKGEIALKVRDLKAFSDAGAPALKGVSFDLRRGEVLGIAGVTGNGQEELSEVLAGLRPSTAGSVSLLKRDITNLDPRKVKEAGLGFIPSDRMGMGIIRDFSVAENLLLKHQEEKRFRDKWILPLKKDIFINKEEMKRHARSLIKEFDIKVPNEDTPAKNLSGGNIQKLILARELWQEPDVLIACYPTRGLDVGSIESVRKILKKQVEAGSALLLISESLEELKLMSNRIAVMYEGEILDVVPPSTRIEDLGLLMGGKRVRAK